MPETRGIVSRHSQAPARERPPLHCDAAQSAGDNVHDGSGSTPPTEPPGLTVDHGAGHHAEKRRPRVDDRG